ncbi:uncharacterized protein [Heliangelus exortis]|uniref:uncharacterized protein isoform X2 n=1 Tax=Heliangelus exortis TaxID=472823 RepID=UPI003A8E0BD1
MLLCQRHQAGTACDHFLLPFLCGNPIQLMHLEESKEKGSKIASRMASHPGSGPAPRFYRPVLSPGMGSPATLAAGDLAEGLETLAVTAPEGGEKDAAVSRAKVEAVEKAAETRKVETPERAHPGGKVVTPEAAVILEASEKPEAGGVAEAFARAAERIAKSEVTKVLQLAIAELKEKRRNMWLKPRNPTQQEEEEDWTKEGEVK